MAQALHESTLDVVSDLVEPLNLYNANYSTDCEETLAKARMTW